MNEKFKLITHLACIGAIISALLMTSIAGLPVQITVFAVACATFVSVCVATD